MVKREQLRCFLSDIWLPVALTIATTTTTTLQKCIDNFVKIDVCLCRSGPTTATAVYLFSFCISSGQTLNRTILDWIVRVFWWNWVLFRKDRICAVCFSVFNYVHITVNIVILRIELKQERKTKVKVPKEKLRSLSIKFRTKSWFFLLFCSTKQWYFELVNESNYGQLNYERCTNISDWNLDSSELKH